MSQDGSQNFDRRDFLKVAGASGGLFGMSALAGCSGGDGGDGDGGGGGSTDTETEMEDTETEMEDTETEMDSGGSMGDAFPEYRYFNNPPNYNPARNDAINLMGEQLSQVGFNMNVKVFEWGTLYNKVTSEQDFEFTTWHRGLGIDPGRRYPEMFHSSNTGPGQGNFVGYENEDLDPKLMKQMSTTNRNERINLLHDIQEVITRDAPINPITQMPILVAYNSNQVSGWVDHLGGYNYFYNMTTIEVDNQKNQLRGSWSETLGTLNVLGFNNETKLLHQFDVIYDNLVRFNPDLQPDPELGLANDWERPNKTTMRYTIRDHQWHDGEDVTAEDVAFTMNYIKENEIPLYSTQTGMYSDAEAVDSQTVQVNFTEDGAPGPVHTLFSSQIPILPKHIWEGRDQPNQMQVKEPIGSGPMQFDYWDTGSELGLVKNSNHWRPTKFDSRIWRIIPEASTVWSLLKQGELNYLPFSRIGKQLSDNQELDQIGVKQMPGDSWWHMSMNERVPGLDQRAVRQACVHSIPKTAIVQQLLFGFPDKGFNLISPAFGEFHNPDVMTFEEGVEPAKARLQEAGFKFDDDGMVHFPAN